MSLLDRLAFWRQKNIVTPPNPERTLEGSMWYGTEAQFLSGDSEDGQSFLRHGVLVTPEIALQVGTVWACIDVQAKAIASSEWVVIEQVTPKRRKVLYDDNLTYLLNTRPNNDMSAQAFRRAMVIAVMSWGNAYALISWNLASRVASLYPIHPDRVRPIRLGSGGDLMFVIRNDDGTSTTVEEKDLFRIRGPSIIGMLGANRIGQAAGAIALSMATNEFSQAFFSNGGAPGGIVKIPGKLDDSARERLQKQWGKQHKGPRKAFTTAFLDNGMEYTSVPNDGNKMQMIESRKEDALSICRYWGIPPHLVQIMDHSTLGNIEHQGLEFVRNCLRPIAREFNQEGDHKLFSDRGPKRRLHMDLDWMSEGDFKSRMEGLNIARDDGVLNANEIREEIGWDDMGSDGDKYIVQGAMIELKDVGLPYKNQAAAAAKKSATTPTEPAEPEEEDDVEDPDTAMARAWVKSVYASVLRFQRNRLKDLGTQEGANTKARTATVMYLMTQTQDLIKNFSTSWGRDVSADVILCGKEAIDLKSETADAAVDFLFDRLKRAR